MDRKTKFSTGATAVAGAMLLALVSANTEYAVKALSVDTLGFRALLWLESTMHNHYTALFIIASLVVGAAIYSWLDIVIRKWLTWKSSYPGFSLSLIDRRLAAMTFAMISAACFALSILWFLAEKKFSAPTTNMSAADTKKTDTDNKETFISLRFHLDGIPEAINLSNIWRWYALKNIAVFQAPQGNLEVRSWNIFLTFDKPIAINQVIIESDKKRPRFEVKDRDSRSVVIAFMEDIQEQELKIRILTEPPSASNFQPKNLASQQEQRAANTKPRYESNEIGLMLNALRLMKETRDKEAAAAYRPVHDILDEWENIIQKNGAAHLKEKAIAAYGALNNANNAMGNIINETAHYRHELEPVISDNRDGFSDTIGALQHLERILGELEKAPQSNIDLKFFVLPIVHRVQSGFYKYDKWLQSTDKNIAAKTQELRNWSNP